MKVENIEIGKGGASGGSGAGGGFSSSYECQFCGSHHIRGVFCPEFKKILKEIGKRK